MTDEVRLRLRNAIELLVSYADRMTEPRVVTTTGRVTDLVGVEVRVLEDSSVVRVREFAPLTPAQHLALSVLLGEVDGRVLADFVLDQGHEYATECYERGKAEALETTISTPTPPGATLTSVGWPRWMDHT